jgi:hypothetical protein
MKLSNLLPRAIVMCSLMPLAANAQIVSCNAFLQGNYIEVGISPVGSFGSSAATPTGYHGNTVGGSSYAPCGGATGSSHLGFVADPAMDGWSVGTPPFFGDYFLPGSPFEGWSLQVGTAARVDAWNSTAALPAGLTGSNISHSATSTHVTSTWEGMYDSIKITQVTTIPVSALYFTVKVTLTNLSAFAKNNIYYMRTLDPDNDQQQMGGAFPTNNTIVHQLADSAAVRAVGTGFSAAALTLGALDSNAECLIYSSWPLAGSVNLASIYSGASTGLGTAQFTQGGTQNGDVAIGLVFKTAHIASVDSAADSLGLKGYSPHPANQASFTFYYAFSPAAEDSAMATIFADSMVKVVTTPPISHVAVQNIASETPISLYPNPTQDNINITGLEATDKVIVFDMMGKTIEAGWQISAAGTNVFSTSIMPAGNYVIMVKNASGNIKARIPMRKL